MEVDGNGTYGGCKFLRIVDGDKKGREQYLDAEEDGYANPRSNNGGGDGGVGGGGGGDGGGGFDFGRFCGWHSSRIVRVTRASGGKDRHSKVLTSKGLRDRRVRLSANTAISFYDLQDRLGYHQPSKAVEWLLKAAASSIAELPSINTSFPDTIKKQQQDRSDIADVEIDTSFDPNYQIQQHQKWELSRSACSSNSDNSKEAPPEADPLRDGRPGFSRSRSRIKAREQARGRAAEKEKDKENETNRRMLQNHQHGQLRLNLDPIELLSSGMKNNSASNGSVDLNHSSEANFFDKSYRNWFATPTDYFATGLLRPLLGGWPKNVSAH